LSPGPFKYLVHILITVETKLYEWILVSLATLLLFISLKNEWYGPCPQAFCD